MRIINSSLFNVHDVIVIAAISIISHYTLIPIYNKIAKKG